jgi:hypothetical protein
MSDVDVEVTVDQKLSSAGRDLATALERTGGKTPVMLTKEQEDREAELKAFKDQQENMSTEERTRRAAVKERWEATRVALQAERENWDHARIEVARAAMRAVPSEKSNYGDQLSKRAVAYLDAVHEQINKTPYKDEAERRETIRSLLQVVQAVQERVKDVPFTSEEQGYAMQVAVLEAVGTSSVAEGDADVADLLGQNIISNKKEILTIGRKSEGLIGWIRGDRKGSTEVNLSKIEDAVEVVFKSGEKQKPEVQSAVAAVRNAVQPKYPIN